MSYSQKDVYFKICKVGDIIKIEFGNQAKDLVPVNTSSKFETGKKFNAEIKSVEQGKVTFKLDSGNVMTVSGKLPKNVAEGDVVSFLVKSNENGVILIETVTENASKSLLDIVKSALEACDMYPTDENINLVKALAEKNLPMDTDTIQKAAFGYYSLKDASIDELVFILQEKLPITEKTLEKINLYINNNVRLQKDVEKLSADILKMDNAFDKIMAFSILTDDENSAYVMENLKFASKSGIIKEFIELTRDFVLASDKGTGLVSIMSEGIYEDLPHKNEYVKFVEKAADSFLRNISGKEISNRLREALNIRIDKKEITGEVNVFFQKLYEKVSALKYVLPLNDKSSALNESVNNIKNNIEFMNEISNYRMYMQLPLLADGSNTQADLYFFKNPRSKKVSKDNATVMLSLNLANLGHIDTLIQKKGNTIDLKFCSENSKVHDKIKKNIFVLGGLLSEKGYIIGSHTYAVANKRFNLTSDIETEAAANESFTFDIKA